MMKCGKTEFKRKEKNLYSSRSKINNTKTSNIKVTLQIKETKSHMLTTVAKLRKKISVKNSFGNCSQELKGSYKGLA